MNDSYFLSRSQNGQLVRREIQRPVGEQESTNGLSWCPALKQPDRKDMIENGSLPKCPNANGSLPECALVLTYMFRDQTLDMPIFLIGWLSLGTVPSTKSTSVKEVSIAGLK